MSDFTFFPFFPLRSTRREKGKTGREIRGDREIEKRGARKKKIEVRNAERARERRGGGDKKREEWFIIVT